MKKLIGIICCLLMLLLCASALADVEINETNFPDEAFRNYVISEFDSDGDRILTDFDLYAFRRISIDDPNVQSLEGIKYFTSLETLYCYNTPLTSLDVSNCTTLENLYCINNQLSSLNVSGCTSLKYLTCNGNQLTELDVSSCTALEQLYAGETVYEGYSNLLTTLDVSRNTALEILWCDCNKLTSLDVSKCESLEQLSLRWNQVEKLDVSHNPKLWYLNCGENLLSGIDVSHNPALEELWYQQNNYTTTLDVSNNKALRELSCWNCSIDHLDVSNNTALTGLYCQWNQLSSLDISKNTALQMLYCEDNQLTTLDISHNPGLTHIMCGMNKLAKLDLSQCTGLKNLYCQDNQLTSLDVSKNKELSTLECERNKLTKLDISGCPILVNLVNQTEVIDGESTVSWYESKDDGTDLFFCIDSTVKLIKEKETKIPVSGIKLNKSKASLSITLSKKGTVTLKATVSPAKATNKAVTWKSSNTKVAKVNSSGKVTAVGYGTCTITCTAKDGSKKKATCKVTVTVDEVKDLDLKYSLNHEDKTATVTGPLETSIRQATVASTVKANGKTYKVTAIKAKAFKGMKKLVTFNTGKNLKTIGASAFEGCTKLDTIGVQSKDISKIGTGAFKNIGKNVKLYMSQDLVKSYIKKLVKLLTDGGIKKITQIFE